jgi:hypothetical protein
VAAWHPGAGRVRRPPTRNSSGEHQALSTAGDGHGPRGGRHGHWLPRARNLTATMDALSAVLPDARRVTLAGVGHTAADNGGRPGLVAAQLRAFFT